MTAEAEVIDGMLISYLKHQTFLLVCFLLTYYTMRAEAEVIEGIVWIVWMAEVEKVRWKLKKP